MAYGTKVVDHYENPRNVGNFGSTEEVKTRKDVGVGLVGAEFAATFTHAMLPDLAPRAQIGALSVRTRPSMRRIGSLPAGLRRMNSTLFSQYRSSTSSTSSRFSARDSRTLRQNGERGT